MMPIFYIPINYPNPETFFKLLDSLEKFGVTTIEIGIPVLNAFQDGELIQNINREIILRGLSYDEIELTLNEIRKKYSFQVILMTYEEGVKLFSLKKLPKNSYDGLLCVNALENDYHAFNHVEIITPAMSEKEISKRLERPNVFIYLTSTSGKTGGNTSIELAPYKKILPLIKKKSKSKIYVGFGIKNKADVLSVINSGADGAIIGSEFLRKFQNGGFDEINNYLNEFSTIAK